MQRRYISWKALSFLLGIILLLGVPSFCLMQVLSAAFLLPNNIQIAQGSAIGSPTPTVFLGYFPTSVPPVSPMPTPTPIPALTQATMASFAGTWVSHMGSFTMQSDGHATVEMDGGVNDKLLFTNIVQTTAVGKVISSNVGNTGKAVTATLESNDAIDVSGYNTFCGPHAPGGWCGA